MPRCSRSQSKGADSWASQGLLRVQGQKMVSCFQGQMKGDGWGKWVLVLILLVMHCRTWENCFSLDLSFHVGELDIYETRFINPCRWRSFGLQLWQICLVGKWEGRGFIQRTNAQQCDVGVYKASAVWGGHLCQGSRLCFPLLFFSGEPGTESKPLWATVIESWNGLVWKRP